MSWKERRRDRLKASRNLNRVFLVSSHLAFFFPLVLSSPYHILSFLLLTLSLRLHVSCLTVRAWCNVIKGAPLLSTTICFDFHSRSTRPSQSVKPSSLLVPTCIVIHWHALDSPNIHFNHGLQIFLPTIRPLWSSARLLCLRPSG